MHGSGDGWGPNAGGNLRVSAREKQASTSPPAVLARPTSVGGCPPPPSRPCCTILARCCGTQSRFEQVAPLSPHGTIMTRGQLDARAHARWLALLRGTSSALEAHSPSQRTPHRSCAPARGNRPGRRQDHPTMVIPSERVCSCPSCVLRCELPLLRSASHEKPPSVLLGPLASCARGRGDGRRCRGDGAANCLFKFVQNSNKFLN